MKYSIEEKLSRLKGWEQSGLSKREFCINNGYAYFTFLKWNKVKLLKLQEHEVKTTTFIQSNSIYVPSSENYFFEIVKETYSIKVPSGFSSQELKTLIEVLSV